ncbi:putative TetR family transcriptional regulator [Gordonia paraffinivorans NBRC 108238]|uniref:TetR family transcriptional regulator n=2 Tax=Gordonia paraffinivorans TaxID=175628 RepID=A0ABQ0IRH4_9ACTN|nr:putative TetR family transcriptional regulator [Gordonia paraffinivorans NBRC 108238]
MYGFGQKQYGPTDAFGSMNHMMTSAATPKGARRRSRLIEAAGELLLEGGFDAVRHRAVAERAQLPLASTTYYFESLDDLMAEAAASVCEHDEAAITERAKALPRRRRGTNATATALAEVFVGADTTIKQLSARYEMIALSARYPQLREVVTRRWRSLSTCHMDVLSKSGRIADPAHVAQLIGIEDGAIVGALGQTAIRPVDAVHDALLDVVDVLAPRE